MMEMSNGHRKNDNSDSEKNCDGDGVPLTPIQKIPREIWVLILDYLDNSRDMISASNAVQLWNEILYPTRKAWMLDQILPLLLPHLTSKKDILSCRLVCRSWCSGVDYFMCRHNDIQRPASSEPLSLQKTSNRLSPLVHPHTKFKLLYKPINHPKYRNRIANPKSAKLQPNIIGRSLLLHESKTTIRRPHLSNIPFLQKVGAQIYFLHINFTHVAPADMLAQLTKILELVPYLKKLEIINRHTTTMSNLSYSLPSFPYRCLSAPHLPPSSSYQNLSAHLPKNLDTLGIHINHTQLTAILLSTFISPKLKSLTVDPLPPLATEKISSPLPLPSNLLQFCVSIRRNNQWKLVSSPDSPFKSCPISRLTLHVYTDSCQFQDQVDLEPLTQILSRFKSTLKTFALQLSYEFDRRNNTQRCTNHFDFFATTGALNLPHLTRLSLAGKLPISLNFILGVAGTLEYLHLYVDSYRFMKNRAIEMLQLVTSRLRHGEEHCDLLKIIFSIITLSENWARDMNKEMGKMIYDKSNLWTLFPRLKVITVNTSKAFDKELWPLGFVPGSGRRVRHWRWKGSKIGQKTREWKFRRDVYEKMHEKCLEMF